MKAMDKAFIRVDETFEAIRDSLNQQAINNIARKLAQDLRRVQQARIRSQKAPDGTAWTPRRRRVTRIQERIRFIWNNEARTLKNWHHDTGKYGRTITGWDEDKNSIRTFYRDDIDRFLEIRKALAVIVISIHGISFKISLVLDEIEHDIVLDDGEQSHRHFMIVDGY